MTNDPVSLDNNEPTSDHTNESFMMRAIKAEIDDLIKKSTNLKSIITTAKTATKRALYVKKLKKNNKELMQMLVAFKRVEQNQPVQSSIDLSQDVDTDIVELDQSSAG